MPFISRDPPSHGEYRKFVMPALTPKRLEGVEQRISERCAALLVLVPLDEAVDFVPLLFIRAAAPVDACRPARGFLRSVAQTL